jgi:polyisoprenoid-binding protein YceI
LNYEKTRFVIQLTDFVNVLVKAQTNTWVIDNMHSNIGFKISHMGISLVEGEFNDFSEPLRLQRKIS